MEVKKIHNVDIYVNGQLVDINSNKNLGLRINNTFSTPEKIETISTTYSFAFNLPMTPTNNKIFDYANVLSKRNKFNKAYDVSVEIDNLTAFTGLLMVQSVTKDNGYKCNIYVNKLNTVEEVFGNSLMSDLASWNVEFNLAETINDTNQKVSEGEILDCFYPLVSYGMFQKVPKDTGFYTSKHDIDKYNRFYMENFYPSINLLNTVKRCFEHKGYSLEGDVLDDDDIKRIYMSTSLADGQDPEYNFGLSSLGKVTVNTKWTNKYIYSNGGYALSTHTVKDLDEPIMRVGRDYETGNFYYNYNQFNIYNIWNDTFHSAIDDDPTYDESKFMQEFSHDNSYLFRDNGIVIPVDGWYKIEMDVKYDINDSSNSNIVIDEYYIASSGGGGRNHIGTREKTLRKSFDDLFTEIQLVKNDLENSTINPIAPTEQLGDCFEAYTNSYRYYSPAYPHEPKGTSAISTEANPYTYGYTPPKTGMLAYDPWVNKDFIMGMCSAADCKYGAVIRNGKSWNSECADYSQSRFICQPYLGIPGVRNSAGRGVLPGEPQQTTDYSSNTLPNGLPINVSQSHCINYWTNDNYTKHYDSKTFNISNSTLTFGTNVSSQTGLPSTYTECSGKIRAIVYLKKNDILQLKLITRCLNNPDSNKRGDADAKVNVDATITVEAFGESTMPVTSDKMDWNMETQMETDLNLVKFLNKEEKMSDFINNFIKEFNLSYSQNGNIITLNKQKFYTNVRNVVDLSDRVSDADIEVGMIDYPSSMAVKYSINEEERGFYNSVPFELLELPTWKEYADRGYDVIKITDEESSSEATVSLKTSYNWYDTFHMDGTALELASIALDEWMIDGYKDEEMMKKDGYNLKRRYWFPTTSSTGKSVSINNNPQEIVDIYTVTNEHNGFDLSYHLPKKNQDTILSRFFNVFYPTDSNTVTFSCYLTTQEYINIKNGANVMIDDDIYIVTEIKAFDPTGYNKTTIVAIKK